VTATIQSATFPSPSGPVRSGANAGEQADPTALSRAVRAAGQAGVVAHVAAHELGAAAYAIKAARAAAPGSEGERAVRRECRWQREQLPEAIRELVLDDQRVRNEMSDRSVCVEGPPEPSLNVETSGCVRVATFSRLVRPADAAERSAAFPG